MKGFFLKIGKRIEKKSIEIQKEILFRKNIEKRNFKILN